MTVREVMTSPVSTLQARTPLQPAAALLVAQGSPGLRWSTATGHSSTS